MDGRMNERDAGCRAKRRLVSVVIPCHNHGEFLGEAIDSVRAQEYPDIEIIVVNDGSTDKGTLRALASLESDVILIEQPNKGLVAARNRGIQGASGIFVLPLDADDKISPEYIRLAVSVMDEDENVGIVYGQTELFGSKSGLWHLPAYSMPEILFENMIVATALFRKSDWQRVGGYRQSMVYAWEDWDLWLAIIATGCEVVRLDKVVFYYRISTTSMTNRLSFGQKLSMMMKIVLRHRRLYLANLGAVIQRLSHPAMRTIEDPRSGKEC
jgi:glycosyltransferase involved in cell wall biosynthesis